MFPNGPIYFQYIPKDYQRLLSIVLFSYNFAFLSPQILLESMVVANVSLVMEFILLGITEESELKVPLFFLFIVIYMVGLLGNLALMSLIVQNSHLHTPMYFFLLNL